MLKIFNLFYILLFTFVTCTAMEKEKPFHHTKNGFRNLDSEVEVKGLGDVLSWQFSKLFQSKQSSVNPSDYKFEVITNDGAELRKNSHKTSFTWIGHATLLIQLDGKNILTDPIWSQRCSPVGFAGPKRYTQPGLKLEDLPLIHIVLISHNHYDHLDLPTLIELEKRFSPTFFVGLKNADLLKTNGIQKVFELDWWEEISLLELSITFTPTQHFSARGVFDRNQTLWGSFVVLGKEHSFFFAGDTGYFSGFKEIRKKFPNLDFAILPIGAYEPRWFMKAVHMNPEDAVQAFLDLQAKYFIPMHYQTFVLSDEGLDAPLSFTKAEFQRRSLDINKLLSLKIGESKFF